MSDEKAGKPKRGKPISLYPLNPKDVLAALLRKGDKKPQPPSG